MNIYGNFVILRAIEREDLEILHRAINDPFLEKMEESFNFPISLTQQEKWLENVLQNRSDMRLMIEYQGAAVGWISLTNIDWKNRTAELSQKIKAEASERVPNDIMDAMMGFLHYAFYELNLNCIYGTVLEYNHLSRKLARKCGLKEEGVLRERIFKNGKYHNLIPNSIIKSDFDNAYKKYKEERIDDK